MSVSVASQLTALLGGAALGVGVGLLYDGLGSVRRRISGPIRRSLLDLLFWLAATAALLLWSLVMEQGLVRFYTVFAILLGGVAYFFSVRAGGGVVQVSVCAALFLGTVGYLRVLSPVCRNAFDALIGLLSSILHLIGAPFRLFCRLGSKSINFFENFFKKHFSFPPE